MTCRLRCTYALSLGTVITGLGMPSMPSMPSLTNMHLPIPDITISKGDQSDAKGPSECQVEPSGWPTKLDWGIYWFGPDFQSKKAKPRPQTKLFDLRTWFYSTKRNATKDWEDNFYDPSRKTVIYMHGDSGSGSWSMKSCSRAQPRCKQGVCPDGFDESLVDSWIRKGWNVGFFYWDQFADKPGARCNLATERRIWFDSDGEGLHWNSYEPETQQEFWKPYENGTETTITDLCVSAVKEAMGDFYSGSSVRFVGRSIGAQLAVACAAELHHQGHVAAPQRLTLLDPIFSSADYTFFGAAFQCDGVTLDDGGIDDFAKESTANYVRMLWVKKKVVTEVFASEEVDSDLEGQAVKEMQKYSLWVIFKPSWCKDKDKACQHNAVFPLYWLSLNNRSLQVMQLDAAGRPASDEQVAKCPVPSASCSDAELRALVEVQLQTMNQNEYAQIPQTRWVWSQSKGVDTFAWNDDLFSFAGRADLRAVTPSPTIEDEIGQSVVMLQRDWGMWRKWKLGKSSGMSLLQLQTGLGALLGIVVASLIPLVLAVAYRSMRFAYSKIVSPDDDDDDDEDLDFEEGSGGSSCGETESFVP